MKTYVFDNGKTFERLGLSTADIRAVLNRIARGTDTRQLVIAVYGQPSHDTWRGVCYGDTKVPADFVERTGTWRGSIAHGIPTDLPREFKLIRLMIGSTKSRWPRRTSDKTHQLILGGPCDLLAFLFGHELAHFRSYHLGLPPGRGETRATAWSIEHASALGYDVAGSPLTRILSSQRKQIRSRFQIGSLHVIAEAWPEYERHKGTEAIVISQPRGSARRVLVGLRTGERFYWPIEWLQTPNL